MTTATTTATTPARTTDVTGFPATGSPVVLDRAELHAAVGDPVLTSMNFLNEVMGRFPGAISFAPGAPHDSFLADVDAGRHIATYLDHLRRTAGLPEGEPERRLYRYGAAAGQINALVARQLRLDEGIMAAPEAVVVTVGCQEAMFITLRALHAGPDDVLIVPEPCYVGVMGAAKLLGITVRTVDQSEGTLDLDRLAALCAEIRAGGGRPRSFYLVPDFANPSGARMDLPARKALLALAEEQDLLLLEDNPYGFTAAPGSELPTLKLLDRSARVVYLGTYAKVCMPGARVGFVVADQQVRDADGGTRLLADELTAIKSMVTVNTSPISQAVIGGILVENGGSLREPAARKAAFYQHNLAVLRRALERHFPRSLRRRAGIDWHAPDGGFFLMMDVPFDADEDLLEVSAREFGVLWTPMRHFFAGPGGTHRLRLSSSYLDPTQIEEGTTRLAAFIQSRL
ncbi:aminotransferase-like domain-containing protein [Actinacidiphila guanduensis]|uniref:Hydroxyphenylglycine aminotransferase n=1 Tax=Actinacidiphila guanduensis TaxID=310781 RepID=A0A1H0FNA7_9ACTN|nr:PLP-dependent aminotransferase family protein [Actinacidiphila guanduensis]SDN96001.1 hydroxyphenylglycine aminotransferase [Actinacidiphila guanduensis]